MTLAPTAADIAAQSKSNSPARRSVAVTKSDTVDIAFPAGEYVTRALYVGAGGDLRVQFIDDADPQTLPAVPDGAVLPIMVTRVYATGTTASSIIALL